jgi:hypothetical protein
LRDHYRGFNRGKRSGGSDYRHVIGENIQKVGYRAMIQKQAIKYNLAGYARNNPDGTVGVGLQATKVESPKRWKLSAPGTKNRRRLT